MSHWSWCHPAAWNVAFLFLFLSSISFVLQSLISLDSLFSKCVQSFVFSSFPIQFLKAFSLFYYVLHIFVGLVIFPADVLHISQSPHSKASSMSLSFFLSVQVSVLYNATLQTMVFITFFFRSLLIIFERSSLLLLNAF